MSTALAGLDRARRCYVYLVLAKGGGSVFAKIGISSTPDERLQTVARGAPFEPEMYALIERQSQRLARNLERDLLGVCLKWRSRGEWLVMSVDDAAEFRQLTTQVLDEHSRGGLRLRWKQVSVSLVRNPRNARVAPRKLSYSRVLERVYSEARRTH